MPVSRVTAESLSRKVADLYAEAERILLERIARNLAKGIEGPAWAQQKLAQMNAYEAQTRALIADLQRQAKTGVTSALTEAYKRGGLAAVADVAGITEPLAGLGAVEAIAAETLTKLNATSQRVLVTTRALYRDAVEAGVNQVLLGVQTRISATQGVLDRFAARGITGFVDSAGRAWDLASYSEMAVRTGTMNAAIAGHVDTLAENGLDLVVVSADGSPCDSCAPWEGEVLSASGNDPNYPSLDDATGSSHLLGPNCLHTVSAWQEGVTRSYPEKTAADREAEAVRYKDNQRLRAIERNIRSAKRTGAVAMDPSAQKAAAAKVAKWQAAAREHVASTSAVRQYPREAFGKAH
jgi:hypothetical protein